MSSENFVFEVELIERELINVTLHTIDVAPGASTLGNLSDVNLQNVINSQIIRYNSTTQKWENVNLDVVIEENSVYSESPTKITSTQFQTANAFMAGSLRVFLNGIKEKYVVADTSDKFSFDADTIVGDVIEVNYIKDI